MLHYPLMSEKQFVTIFIIVAAVALGGIIVNKFQDSFNPIPSPSASDNNLSFNTANPDSLGNSSATSPPTPLPSGQIKQFKTFPLLSQDKIQGKKATITTTRGKIEFSFYPEASQASSSFIFLTNQHFFDGLTFHRVEPGFVIQGGDPLGNGTGGPGYRFPDELEDNRTYTKGVVAMANSGKDTNGSQFFIMLEDHPELPHNYTIFGTVISGQDVVEKIEKGDVMEKVEISN